MTKTRRWVTVSDNDNDNEQILWLK